MSDGKDLPRPTEYVPEVLFRFLTRSNFAFMFSYFINTHRKKEARKKGRLELAEMQYKFIPRRVSFEVLSSEHIE